MERIRVALLDVDGTLVDSVYHHALAWQRAFAALDLDVPMHRLHREIGKGGDQLVPDVAGEQFERRHGDRARTLHDERFDELIGEVRPLDGVRELIAACRDAGWRVAIASSGRAVEIDHYLALLGIGDELDAVTTSDDVDTSKPAPDAFGVALERVGEPDPAAALVIGDATWDCIAARKAGMTPVAVLTGGFGADELRAAGAAAVHPTLAELRAAVVAERVSA